MSTAGEVYWWLLGFYESGRLTDDEQHAVSTVRNAIYRIGAETGEEIDA